MAISLRSGKEIPSANVDKRVEKKVEIVHDDNIQKQEQEEEQHEEEKEVEKSTPIPVKPYVPPIPYPQRLKKRNNDTQFQKFLEIFKKIHINIPFAEALAQMPSYAKFLKEIVSNKSKLEEYAIVTLTEECSAIL